MIACDLCTRGIIHVGDWGNPCKVCEGSGLITLSRLCFLLGENRSTVIKLLKPRRKLRAKTAARLLDGLLALTARYTIEPSSAPESG